MGTENNESLTFYPAFCFKASPIHFTWVKIGAADVHRLRKFGSFAGMSFVLLVSLFLFSCLNIDISILKHHSKSGAKNSGRDGVDISHTSPSL